MFVDVITSAAYEAIALAHDPEDASTLDPAAYTSQKISSDIFELIASNLPVSQLSTFGASITASNPIYDGSGALSTDIGERAISKLHWTPY